MVARFLNDDRLGDVSTFSKQLSGALENYDLCGRLVCIELTTNFLGVRQVASAASDNIANTALDS